MLLKIGGITLHHDDVRLIVPGAEKTTVFLSTTDGGRTASLDKASAEKLDLFLTATGRIDLDGPAFKREVYEAAANFRAQAAELEAYLLVVGNQAHLEQVKQRLDSKVNASARLPPKTAGDQVAPKPQLVPRPAPPALPATDDFNDPDPMTFVRRGPKLRNPALDEL